MPYYPAYIDTGDIVDFCKAQNPDFNSGDLYGIDMELADTLMGKRLYDHGMIKFSYNGTSGATKAPTDKQRLLRAASLMYNAESLSYRGKIQYNVGGIQELYANQVRRRYMRMQPMFFMGNNPDRMDAVMPFRSFKQIGDACVLTYCTMFHQDSGTKGAQPVMAWDASSRGFGAIADLDDYMNYYDDELTGSTPGITS